jgi:DNA-binding NtrC family response regulator
MSNLEKLKLLIVDDDRSVFDGLRRVLRNEPFEIVYAPSGLEALKIAGSSNIDIVICDEFMPGLSGTEVLKKFSDKFPATIRIMLSGRLTLNGLANTVNSASLFRCFQKPIDAPTIIKGLRDAMSSLGRLPADVSPGSRKVEYQLSDSTDESLEDVLDEVASIIADQTE